MGSNKPFVHEDLDYHILFPRISLILERLKNGQMSDSEFVACYVISFLQFQAAQRTKTSFEKRKEHDKTLQSATPPDFYQSSNGGDTYFALYSLIE